MTLKEIAMDEQQPTPIGPPTTFDSHTHSAAGAHSALNQALTLLTDFRTQNPDTDQPVHLELTLNLKPGEPQVTGPDVKILNTFLNQADRDVHVLDLGYPDTRIHCTGCDAKYSHPAVPDGSGKRISRAALQRSFQDATTAAAAHADACTSG